MSTAERAAPRRGQQPLFEPRPVAFFVRAKTGPGSRDWSPVGVAFARRNNEPGFTIKINTWPIDMASFKGALVLVPPFVEDDAPIEEDTN